MSFKGFSDNTIRFFLDVRFNNYTGFINAHRAEYDEVKKEFFNLVDSLAPTLMSIDKTLELRPNKCLSRINRDVRFSKDKSPYRDHLFLTFRKFGIERYGAPFFYFELSPEAAAYGMGIWGDSKDFFNAFRAELLKNPNKFIKVFNNIDVIKNKFIIEGSNYKRMVVPEELPKDLIPFYTKKMFYISKKVDPYSTIFTTNLYDNLVIDYINLAPIYKYLSYVYKKVNPNNWGGLK
ncbi:MAG: DUF2461 domain-containing protein [Christensenellaceae bacterium]|nr:DUF2461 domain-containing protein [Christensenellaceae bacterium]